MQWPKTETGAVDWEAAFEHPAKGMVPLVKAARSPAKVRKVTAVLVEHLLMPGSEPDKRGEYRAALAALMAKDKPPETLQPDAIALLRAIKDDRIAKDGAGGEAPNAPDAPDAEDSPDAPDAPDGGAGSGGAVWDDGEDGDENETEAGENAPSSGAHVVKSAEYVTGAFFLRQYEERFRVLHERVPADFPSPPPYLLSRQFANRFVAILANRFVDRVIDANYIIVKRCDGQDPEKRDAYLEEAFEDISERRRFFERWKGIWLEKTEQKRPPRKPKIKKDSGGVLSKLAGKKDKKAMSEEEWEAAVAKVEEQNREAKEISAEIMAESSDYIAPKKEDMEVLMGLLGRTPIALEKQITAISQIGLQSRSTSAFDRYQQGRPVDLPLLAASFRHPEAFLGPKGFARDLMRGYREAARVSAFPLVSRFIIDAKHKVYTPKANIKRDHALLSEYSGPTEAAFQGKDGPKDWEPIPEEPQEEEN